MKLPLRVLVVGCGTMGGSHARAYQRIPEFHDKEHYTECYDDQSAINNDDRPEALNDHIIHIH